MTDIDRQKCDEWLKARAKNWQVHRRGDWHYRWKGNTLVRYLDNVSMRELQDGLVLEYLTSDDCIQTLSLYSQEIDRSWKPINAWYETQPMRPPNTGVAQVRLYHALKTDVDDAEGDGPYSVENGCMYKVDFRFYWKQTEVIDLPASSSGVNYRISNLNRDDEDGTFSYVLERRERVEQNIPLYTAEDTSYRRRQHQEVLGKKGSTSSGGLQASHNASNGTVTTRTVRKNEDCTHDVINDTVTEKNVVGSVVETRRTVRGTTVTTTSRSQPVKADASGIGVGDVVRNEQTDSGRWDTTVTNHTPVSDEVNIRKGCTKTIYRHDHSETKVSPTKPPFSDVPNVTVSNAGEINEKTVSLNDDGTYDVTESKKTDIRVDDAEVSVRKTVGGVVRSVTHRNVPEAESTEDLKVGKRVTNRRTDSGLYDVTVDEAQPVDVGLTGTDCANTALEHRHSTTNVVANAPASDEAVPPTEVGTIVEKSIRLTDSGAYQVSEQTRTAKPAMSVSYGGSSKRRVRTESYVNANESSIPAQDPVVNVDMDMSKRVNEFGLVDVNVTTVTHSTRTATATYGGPLVSEQLVETSHDIDGAAAYAPEEGKTVSVSISQNDSGSYEKRIVERTAIKKTWDVEVDTNMTYMYTVFFRNVTVDEMKEAVLEMQEKASGKVDSWNADGRCPGSYRVEPNMSMNEFGLLDGNVQFHAYWEAGSAGQKDDIDVTDFSYAYGVAGEGSSKAGVIAEGRGWNELVKIAEKRRWTGKGSTLGVSVGYNSKTQRWTYSDSICSFAKSGNGKE